ncbi:MAG: tetratricopeptide repeat protein [Candidatus Obscuribacterales bacterium]|nr:tetratricopeptide repeat protein [Candidatus Obscuribacterales bacterium]
MKARNSKYLFSLLGVLLAAATVTAGALELVKPDLLKEEQELVRKGEYQKAITLANIAIEKYSLPCGSDFNSTAKYLSQIKNDRDCDALISNANNKAESFSIRGIAYASVGELALAKKDFDAALSLFPESAVYLCNTGRLLLKQRKYEEAIAQARRALRIDPKLAEGHKLLAGVFNSQGKYKQANAEQALVRALTGRVREDNIYLYTVAVSTEALKLNPRNPYVYRARAYVSWDEHKQRAEADYRKALQLDPNCAAAWAGLAGVYVDSRDFKQAEPMLEKAVRLDPTFPRFWYNKGVMHSLWNQKQKALECYERALKLEPDNPNYWRCRGSIKMKMGNPKGGLADSEQALKLSPNYGQGYILKAQCLSKMSKFHEAIDAANQAIEFSPRRAEGYQIRAYCYKCLDNMELALIDLEKASTLKPEDETIHLDTRDVEAMSGNLESAMLEAQASSGFKTKKSVEQSQILSEISSYTQVIDMSPNIAAPHYDRAILYAATGNLKSAIADLRAFLKYSHWSGKTSSYAVSMLALLLRESGQTAASQEILKQAKVKIEKGAQTQFLQYLLGRLTEASMLAAVKGSRDETRVRILYAIDLFQRSQLPAARREIKWLAENGDRAIDEFVLVSVYSKKMELKNTGGNDKKN